MASKWRFSVPGLQFFEILKKNFHTGFEHHALRCTVDADATTKPEVGVECQKSIKMQVFHLNLRKYENFLNLYLLNFRFNLI